MSILNFFNETPGIFIILLSLIDAVSYTKLKNSKYSLFARESLELIGFLTFIFTLFSGFVYMVFTTVIDFLNLITVYSLPATLVSLFALIVMRIPLYKVLTSNKENLPDEKVLINYVEKYINARVILILLTIAFILYAIISQTLVTNKPLENDLAITDRTVSKKPQNPIKEEKIYKKDYSTYINRDISVTIEQNWNSYNKKFGKYTFNFRYPPDAKIYDGDEFSGSIEILLDQDGSIFISEAPYSYYESPFMGGSFLDWYANAVAVTDKSDGGEQIYEQLVFANGKKYYLISQYPNERKLQYDYFLALQNNVPFYLEDRSSLTTEEVLAILQTIVVF